MRQYFFYFIFLFSCVVVTAQSKSNLAKIPDVDSIFTPKLTGEIYVDKLQYIGSQYFNSDWTIGKVLVKSGDTLVVKYLKYNCLLDELIYLNESNYKIKIDKAQVNEFWIYENQNDIIHFKKNDSNDKLYSISGAFVEILAEGKLSLYVYRRIIPYRSEFKIIDDVRVKYDVLEHSDSYYFKLPAGDVVYLNKLSKRKFLKLFADKATRKNIIDKITENHLKFRSEKDFAVTIDFLNKTFF